MKKWNLIIDVAKCNNCSNCVIAAWDEHIGNDYPGYAAPQPRHGHSWIEVERHVRGRTPMVDVTYVPKMCNHCDDAPCMKNGGADVIRKRADGVVIIDPAKAKGRRDLVATCPYRAMWWNEELRLPQIWIFDAHLLDQGWPHPRCVQVCPTNAMEALKLDDKAMALKKEVERLDVLSPNLGGRPRVYYRNLERIRKVFVGGSVCHADGSVIDCVEGASVEVLFQGRSLARTTTDVFGDFKIDGMEPDGSRMEVKINHDRYGQISVSIEMCRDVYLGTIAIGGKT